MTVDEIIAAMRSLDPTEPNFYGEQNEAHIPVLEQRLGVMIPPSFRNFLIRFGGGDGYTGLFKNRPECLDLGCILGDNLRAREQHGLSHEFILIEISPFRELICLDTARPDENGECPVVRLRITPDNQLTHPNEIANSFAEYFQADLLSRLEVLQEERGEDQPE